MTGTPLFSFYELGVINGSLPSVFWNECVEYYYISWGLDFFLCLQSLHTLYDSEHAGLMIRTEVLRVSPVRDKRKERKNRSSHRGAVVNKSD